jgi:hypothetical protein
MAPPCNHPHATPRARPGTTLVEFTNRGPLDVRLKGEEQISFTGGNMKFGNRVDLGAPFANALSTQPVY